MSNFKKGDLVEVVESPYCPEYIGERFVLTESSVIEGLHSKKIFKAWLTPFRNSHGSIYANEKYIRKVNPDGDNLSEYTFEELMNNLKLPNKEKENV